MTFVEDDEYTRRHFHKATEHNTPTDDDINTLANHLNSITAQELNKYIKNIKKTLSLHHTTQIMAYLFLYKIQDILMMMPQDVRKPLFERVVNEAAINMIDYVKTVDLSGPRLDPTKDYKQDDLK